MSSTNPDLILQQIIQLQELVISDRKETNQHLTKLGDSVNLLAKDYHAVSVMTQIQREQIQEIKHKQEGIEETLEGKLDKSLTPIRKNIEDIDARVQKMVPTNTIVSEIGMTALRWGVPIILGTLLGSYVMQSGAGG